MYCHALDLKQNLRLSPALFCDELNYLYLYLLLRLSSGGSAVKVSCHYLVLVASLTIH